MKVLYQCTLTNAQLFGACEAYIKAGRSVV